MSEDEERARKQAFLNEEIIEKNFNPEAFIEFCERSRGADIDLWTLEELKQCVKAFTTQKPVEDYAKTDILECKTINATCLTEAIIKVQITKPDKVQGLSFKDLLFKVSTLPFGFLVERKLSDFQWLRECILLEFPGHFIPFIPVINIKKLDDPLELNIQMKQLIMFIDYCLTCDLFKRSSSFTNFLQVDNRSNFSKIKKIKIKKPIEARNFTTADGKIIADYENVPEFTKRMEDYFYRFKEVSKKILAETRNFKGVLKEMSQSLSNYSGLMNEAAAISVYMPSFSKPIRDLFLKTSEAFSKLNDKIWIQAFNVDEYFHGTLKFLENQGESLLSIYKEKDVAFGEVDSIKTKINKIVKKDKGVNKDLTDKCKNAQEKAAVMNYLSKSQTEKVLEHIAKTFYKDFMEFWTKTSSELTGIQTVIAMFQDSLEISKGLMDSQL
ncbi:hypothetical protein SteCoe_37068 [Stentor coeruleus]|uniref:PX domain-containing protein n=1 Tax=Stentor coeruleus TaxID=5963 RepID=A0A1R2ANU7_9CILI|nr:hypothetical protein SteCoe_37068 [Stentor coeruleus]